MISKMLNIPIVHNLKEEFLKMQNNEIHETIKKIKSVWDMQTLQQLLSGKVTIPDHVVNGYLNSANDVDLKKVTIKSLNDGKIEITAPLSKVGLIQMTGKIVKLVHDDKQSYLAVKLLNVNLLEYPLMSKVIGFFGLTLLMKIFGQSKIDVEDNLKVSIDKDIVTVDFRERLYSSKASEVEILGKKLLDIVHIYDAQTVDQGTEVKINIDINSNLRGVLGNVIKHNTHK